jgi:hypothetical protein
VSEIYTVDQQFDNILLLFFAGKYLPITFLRATPTIWNLHNYSSVFSITFFWATLFSRIPKIRPFVAIVFYVHRHAYLLFTGGVLLSSVKIEMFP